MNQEIIEELRDYAQELRIQKYAENTIDGYCTYLQMFLEAAVPSQESIKEFFSRRKNNHQVSRAMLKSYFEFKGLNFKIPKHKGRKKSGSLIKKISYEEVKKFVNYCLDINQQEKALGVVVLFETGLRISELLNIKKYQVDIKNLVIRGEGKGRVVFEQPITQDTANWITEYSVEIIDAEKLFRGNRQTWDRFIRKNSFNCLGKKISAHWLRHSSITHLVQNGATVQEAQSFARHSRLDNTMTYLHNLEKKEVNNKAREIFGSK